ncbi:hypothetical protein [Streptomyces sp. NPDC005345]|uniref:hypothetical protein n=1 Tax=Streptomyces sp. NPDC005345 TaxID=3156877 RepID=UPI00339F066E
MDGLWESRTAPRTASAPEAETALAWWPARKILAIGAGAAITLVAAVLIVMGQADGDDAQQNAGHESPAASASTLRHETDDTQRTPDTTSALTLSASRGTQRSVIKITGTGYEPNEPVVVEIWPISCKDPFPDDDDHVVVGRWNAGPDGTLHADDVPMKLNVYPRPDCHNGKVWVRATGVGSKAASQSEYHFTANG